MRPPMSTHLLLGEVGSRRVDAGTNNPNTEEESKPRKRRKSSKSKRSVFSTSYDMRKRSLNSLVALCIRKIQSKIHFFTGRSQSSVTPAKESKKSEEASAREESAKSIKSVSSTVPNRWHTEMSDFINTTPAKS